MKEIPRLPDKILENFSDLERKIYYLLLGESKENKGTESKPKVTKSDKTSNC